MSEAEPKPKSHEIGFVFKKYFTGYGWFDGTVTQIRLNAGELNSDNFVNYAMAIMR
jgi:hypothetical protein